MINVDYPEKLMHILKNSRAPFIPKKLSLNQKDLRLYHRYYSSEFNPDSYFKVIETYDIEEETYGTLSFADNIYWCISINNINTNNVFELIYDKNKILNSNIINSGISYKGYEIKYWFYKNYNKRYSEFLPYIEENGNCKLADQTKYFVSASYVNRNYINPKIQIDKRRD